MKFNLPGVHGGISQQSPNLRLQNQHESSSNVLFDLLEGIRGPRWGTELLSTSASPLNGIIGTIKTTDDRTWFVNWDGTNLRLFDPFTPELVTITDPTTYLTGATSSDLVTLPILDTMIVLNKKKTVTASSVAPSPTPGTAAMIYIPQVYEGLSWEIVVECKSATGASLWSDSTSGTIAPGDTTADLRSAISTGLTAPAGFIIVGIGSNMVYLVADSTIMAQTPTFHVTSNSDFEIRCYSLIPAPIDPNGAAQTFVNTTLSYETLPPSPLQNAYFQVSEGYYVRFDGATYVETACPNHGYKLNKATLPHLLTYSTATGWSFSDVDDYDDLGRLVGDSNSAPMPDFVGRTLNNLVFYRNRLGLLSDNYVALSKVGKYYDWFPDTATEVLDSDPLVVFPTSVQFSELLWAIPFSKQLILVSPRKQYVLHSGYDSLTPQTVAIDEATSYSLVNTLEPLALPASLLLPLAHTPYLGVLEYKLSDQQIATEGSLLSSTVPRFIPSDVTQMLYVPSEHLVLFYKKGTPTIYIYKFNKREDGQLTQMAWSSWEMPENIAYVHVTDDASVLFVTSSATILQMDTSASYTDIALDYYELHSNVGDGDTLSVSSGSIAINADTGKQLDITDAGVVTTDSDVPIDVITGKIIDWELEFSPLVIRDDNGLPRNDLMITIENIQFDWLGGEFSFVIEGQGLPSRTRQIVPLTTTDSEVSPDNSNDSPVPTRLPVMAPARRAKLSVVGTSYFPVQINNVSYNLDVSRDWG